MAGSKIELLDPLVVSQVREETLPMLADLRGSRGGVAFSQASWEAWNVFAKRFLEVAPRKYGLASLAEVGDPATESGTGGTHAMGEQGVEAVLDRIADKIDWVVMGGCL